MDKKAIKGYADLTEDLQWTADCILGDLESIEDAIGVKIVVRTIAHSVSRLTFLIDPINDWSNARLLYQIEDRMTAIVGYDKVRLYSFWPNVPGFCGVAISYKYSDDKPVEGLINQGNYLVAKNDTNQLPILLGVDLLGKPMVIDLAKLSCLAIYGGDTYAQGRFLQPLYTRLADTDAGRSMDFLFIGGQGTNVLPKSLIEANLCPYSAKYRDLVYADAEVRKSWAVHTRSVIRHLSSEVERRKERFEELNVKSFEEYNSKAGEKINRILVVVHNIPNMPDRKDPNYDILSEVIEDLSNLVLGANMRLGVHVVYSNFMPDHDDYIHRYISMQSGSPEYDSTIGMAVFYAQLEAADARRIISCNEGRYSNGSFMVYRSPENEIHGIDLFQTKD